MNIRSFFFFPLFSSCGRQRKADPANLEEPQGYGTEKDADSEGSRKQERILQK